MAKKAAGFGPPLTMAGLSGFPESLAVKCEEGISLRPGAMVRVLPPNDSPAGDCDSMPVALSFSNGNEAGDLVTYMQFTALFSLKDFNREVITIEVARVMPLGEILACLLTRDGQLTIHADPPMKARPPREGRELDLNFRVYAGRRVIFETEMLVSASSLQTFIWLKDEMPGLKMEEE